MGSAAKGEDSSPIGTLTKPISDIVVSRLFQAQWTITDIFLGSGHACEETMNWLMAQLTFLLKRTREQGPSWCRKDRSVKVRTVNMILKRHTKGRTRTWLRRRGPGSGTNRHKGWRPEKSP